MRSSSRSAPFRADVNRALLAVLAGLVILSAPSARAAVKNWNGSLNGNWNTAGNWDPSGVPANGDTLSFPALGGGAFSATTNNIPGAARRFESVNFNAGGYTLRGSAIVVTNGLNSFNEVGANTVLVDLTLGAAQTFNNSSPNFNLNGNIDLAGFNLALDAGDAGDAINANGAIKGAGSVTKLGAGIWRFQGSAPNSFTGATTVSAGELRLLKEDGVTAVPGDLFLRTGARTTWFTDNQVADTSEVTLGSGATLDLNGHVETIGALIATSATVDLGGGTLTLGGDVTVNGATTTVLTPGTLSLGTFSRTIDVAAGATLSIPANLAGGFRTLGIGVLVYAGFTKEGTGALTLSGTNTYGGGTVVNAGRINANSDTAFGATGLLFATPGAVTVNPGAFITLNGVDIGNKALFINAPGPDTAMSASGATSWSGPITLNTNAVFTTVSSLALSNSITGSGGLTLASAMPTALFRFAGTAANDFDGPVFLRIGTLQLAKAAGALAIGSGLTIGGDIAFPPVVRYLASTQIDGDVTIGCNSTLDLNNNSDTIANLTMAGGTVNTGLGTITVNNSINVLWALSPCDDNFINGRLAFFGGAASGFINMPASSVIFDVTGLTINAVIASAPPLTISGNSGRVFLNGANTFTGLLRLASTSGDLLVRLNNPNALGGTAAGTVLDGVQLELGGFNFAAEPMTNVNAGTLIRTIGSNNHGGPIVLNASLRVTNTAALTEFAGAITGPGDLTKTGAGTLRFSGGGVNSFGTMFVNQGLFEMNKTVGITAASPLVIGDGVNTATARHFQGFQTDAVTVNFNSLYDLNGDNEELTSLTLDDGGDVTTGTAVLTMSGNVTVTGKPLSLGDTVSSISGNLDLGAIGTRTFSVAERGSILMGSDPTELIVSAVVFGAAAISKTGAGDMSLTAANTFTGNITVSEGELIISNDDALGATAGTTTLTGGALLSISGGITVAGESLTLNTRQIVEGAVHNTGGTNTWTGPVSLTLNAFIKVETNTALVLSGVISGNGGVTKLGPGRLEFGGAGANTYLGLTRVNEGTLELRKSAGDAIPGDMIIGDGIGGASSDVVRVVSIPQIASSCDITMESSGLLDLNEENEIISTLAGSGRVDLGAAGTGALVLSGNGSTEYSGLIVGTGLPLSALRKRGTGTFTLTGNNTYTGTNLVEQGTLVVNGSQPQSPFVIFNTATLGGNGRIGILAVNNLGNLAPGASPGRLVSGPAKLNAGSNFRVELNGPTPGTTHDQLSVLGAIDLNGALLLPTKGAGYAPVDGAVHVIINNDEADAITGAFGGLSEGSIITVGLIDFRLSYAGLTGNDVTLTVTNIPLRFASSRVEAGNGNGVVDPNECDHLSIVLANRTGGTLSGITARLDSLTPGVAVTQPDSAYPNIPALSFRTNSTPFQIRFPPNHPCGQNTRLSLVVTAAGEGTFAVPFTLTSGGVGSFTTFNSTNLPQAIPDVSVAFSYINVTNNFLVGKVRVSLHATHPAAGDLRFRLFSPEDDGILLSANRGGNVPNYGNSCADRTTFDDAAAFKIAAASAPFNGTFVPEENLSLFIGQRSAGSWSLVVEDSVGGDTGTLQCWSLELAPATCTDGGGECESCLATVGGTLTPASPTLPERISRTFVPSGCGNIEPCPGSVTSIGIHRYNTHTFTNTGPDTCVTVVLTVPCADDTNGLFSAAYLDRFLPPDLCANYLGYSGRDVAGGSGGYSFRVPAGQRFVVMVHERNPTGTNQGCSNYTLELHGLPCPPPVLNIAEDAGHGRVRLFWSTAYPGFQLQRLESLNGTPPLPFVNVPGVPFVIGGDYTVTNSAMADDDYFRLRKP